MNNTNTNPGYSLSDGASLASVFAPRTSPQPVKSLGFKESMRTLIGPRVVDYPGKLAVMAAQTLVRGNETYGRHAAPVAAAEHALTSVQQPPLPAPNSPTVEVRAFAPSNGAPQQFPRIVQPV